jgi:radical SAM protein with 4Fe4S-binding SPASM domain
MIIITREHYTTKYNDVFYAVISDYAMTAVDSLNSDEQAVLRILRGDGKKDFSETEAVLAYHLLVENGIYTGSELESMISETFERAKSVDLSSIKNDRSAQKVEVIVKQSMVRDGCITELTNRFVKTNCANRLIHDSCEVHGHQPDCCNDGGYLGYVWHVLFSLVRKGIIICFYPVKGFDGYYAIPERKIIFKFPEDESKYGRYLSQVIRSSHDVFVYPNTEKLHDKYCGDTFPFHTVRFTSAGISLTEECQLRCKYCSFNSGEKGRTADPANVHAFIDYLVRNAVLDRLIEGKEPLMRVVIAGGGEPTLKWDLFTDTVEYLREKSAASRVPCRIEITTNGIHSPEKTAYLINNVDIITVSFDGLPDIQNENRHTVSGTGSFDTVNSTLKALDTSEHQYSVISVVCPQDFPRLGEIVRFVRENYPNVSNISLRPAMSVGRAVDNDINRDIFSESFAEHYFRMLLDCGFPENVSCGMFRFHGVGMYCGAIYGQHPWLVPSGDIVECQDAVDMATVIGSAAGGTVKMFDEPDIYADHAFAESLRCEGCELYFCCKGGCPLTENSIESNLFRRWACREAHDFLNMKISYLIRNGRFGKEFTERIDCEECSGGEAYIVRTSKE